GDGMALVFYTSPEAPAQCAFEISRALKEHPPLQMRMGIHSGPVSGVVDVNNRPNLAGAGLNIAQRVMDCGDAGHILLSKHVAEDLEEYEQWRPLLHDLGTCEVKHRVSVAIVNLYADEVGNPQLPKRFLALKKHRSHVRWAEAAIGLLVLAAIVAAFIFLLRKPTRAVLNIAEKSGDAVRVNVQLIKAANDSHLWADTFDRKLTDIFSVESEVAKAIADQLRAHITGQEEQILAAKPTDNPEAYDAYLRGLAYTLKTADTTTNALGAQKYLREAVHLDPKFALGWALLS